MLPLKTEIDEDDLLPENRFCFLQNIIFRTVKRRAGVPRFLVNRILWLSTEYLDNFDRASLILREAIYDDYKRSKIKDKSIVRKFLYRLIMNKFESQREYLEFLRLHKLK